jgi:hypothetical protein
MSRRPNQKRTRKPERERHKQPDDFVSVARRLGADEDKARFEAKLGKIAHVRPRPAKRARD